MKPSDGQEYPLSVVPLSGAAGPCCKAQRCCWRCVLVWFLITRCCWRDTSVSKLH